jgi:hypothetical protein
MVYCSICRYNVEYEQHWGSRYRQATCCKFCREEKELEFLPPIVGRIADVEFNMKYYQGRFANLSSVNFVNEKLEHSLYNSSRTAWLEVCDTITNKDEYFFWEAFVKSEILENPGYIQEHEFELVKQFFVENMPPFYSKGNKNHTLVTDMFNNMKL